jgi:DNA polymerase III subunit delta
MEFRTIIRDIELKKIAPFYLMHGDEPYFIDEVTDYIENHVLDEASKSFCQTILYGRDVTLDQVLSLSKGFPMMGDRQVVIVREAQDMADFKKRGDGDGEKSATGKKGGKKEIDGLQMLETYLAAPTPTTMLVLAFKKKFDKRLKVFKTIESKGVVMNSDPIKENKLPEWISAYVQTKGLKITSDAAHLLAAYLGTQLGKVVNEVSKLAIILPKGSTITPQVIEQNIGISKDYNIWELQKALAAKDVLMSNRIIQYFESNPKQNPIQMTIPGLYNYFLKLAIFLSLPDKKNAAAEMGVNPFAIDEYKRAAAMYPAVKVERIIGYLREADKRVKGIGTLNTEDGDIMRELVFKILH